MDFRNLDCTKSQKTITLNTTNSAYPHLLLYAVTLVNFMNFAHSELFIFVSISLIQELILWILLEVKLKRSS